MSEPADLRIWSRYLTGIEAVGAGLVPGLWYRGNHKGLPLPFNKWTIIQLIIITNNFFRNR